MGRFALPAGQLWALQVTKDQVLLRRTLVENRDKKVNNNNNDKKNM